MPGVVVWEYDDTGRRRALVRYDSVSGVRVSRLHWADELLPASTVEAPIADGTAACPTSAGRVIEFPLRLSSH